ncbi:MAG TPA: cupin domain-containing protein [Gaiellaceae bacterium]|jgi:mannose-6-phosphate isomerase-like protein (cupin superfamily)|nr:cupin domain-containing protein [Gaiellaceae bacterium]
MATYVLSPDELDEHQAEGDTASVGRAFDTSRGSEILEQRIVRYALGRSRPLETGDRIAVLYVVSGRGKIHVAGTEHPVEGATGVYVAAGESYEVENPGPEELLVVAVTAPSEPNGSPPAERRAVREADQPTLTASGDREFRYLVTDEVGCRDVTQFRGDIAPGRAPDHSHVYNEVIYVLEGEGALHTEGEDAPVSAGSCIHLPAYLMHSLENSGDSTMRIVAVFHPAGDPASRAYEANE